MSAPLPRVIEWLVAGIVPSDRATTVLADLEAEYQVARQQGGARWWLAREAGSLVAAYAASHIRNALGAAPLVRRDFQLVRRSLRQGRLASLAATALLAVGLFGVMLALGLTQTLLFRQVSRTHGSSLHRIVAITAEGHTASRFSYIEWQHIRERVADAGDLTGVYLQPVVLRTANTNLQTMAEIVDGRYLALTGTAMVLGRGLLAADQQPGGPPVVVIGEPLWRRQFGASSRILGTTVRLNGSAYTVVGVANAIGSSSFLGASVDAWVPVAHADPLVDRGWKTSIDKRWFTLFVLPASGAAALDARLANVRTELASMDPNTWRNRRLQLADGSLVTGSQRIAVVTIVAVLGALASLVLASAAANVAGVLFARAATNRRAAAIHLSIGSGRAAIVRRQLLEGAMLGIAAGVASLALYAAARVEFAEIALLPTLALRVDLPIDATVGLGFIAAGAAAGLLLAVGPALWVARLEVMEQLRDSDARGGTARAMTRLRNALVSIQVALSMVLVFGAALFSRSLEAVMHADLGFDGTRLVAMDFDAEPAGVPPTQFPALSEQALAAVERIPGVVAAAMSNRAPLDQSTPATSVEASADRARRVSDVTVSFVTTRYFDVVTIPLVAGRTFTATETSDAANVVIVNQALAALLWPLEDPLGRGLVTSPEDGPLRVIGVAANARYRSITESSQPHLYRPTRPALGLTLLARTQADGRETLRAMQRELDGVGP
jgi:predicted permease